jgi:hypothetical protein
MPDAIDQMLAAYEQGGTENGFAGDPPDQAPPENAAGEDQGQLPEKYRGKTAEEVYALVTQEAAFNRQRSQQGQEQNQDLEIPAFDRDQSIADYGEVATAAFEAANLNPFELAARVEAGQEISGETIGAYATALRLPPGVVARYVQSFAPAQGQQQGQQQTQGGVSERLVAFLGGAENARSLSQWAENHAPPGDVQAFNDHVANGREEDAKAILQSLWQRRASQSGQGSQPALIRGDAAGGAGDTFSNMDEVEASLYKRNPSTGQRIYLVDPEYRRAHDRKVLRSAKRLGLQQ